MFINSIKMNMSYLMKRKLTVITFAILMVYVAANFCFNVEQNSATQYVSQMFDLTKIGGLCCYQPYIYFLLGYWPLLLMLPTAYIHLHEKNTNIYTYMISRSGKRNYYYSKLVAVFLVTFIVFAVPFLLELAISCICFDTSSLGCPTNTDYLQSIELDRGLFWSELLLANRFLYSIVYICIFAFATAVLAVLNYAITTLSFFRFKILTFIPMYIVLYIISYIEEIWKPSFKCNYFLVLPMLELVNRNDLAYAVFLVICVLLSIILIEKKIRMREIK